MVIRSLPAPLWQYDSRDNQPVVAVSGGGTGQFKEATMNNIGKRMGVIYRESHMQETIVNGQKLNSLFQMSA